MKCFESGGLSSAIDRRNFIKLGAGAMIGLQARAAWSQGSPERPISIDMHTHWAPAAYTKALADLRPASSNKPDPRDFDLKKRLEWMDSHGVQMHVLTLNGSMPWQWVSPEDGNRIAQIVNDADIQAHLAYPDRFMAGIEVSARHPDLALKELNRVAGKPGMRALHLPDSIGGKDYLFDPAYEPLLARCEELGYPLLFHPLSGEPNYYGGKERLGDELSASANLWNTLGFPFESATLASKFIVSGTLDKFPKLEIVLSHSGGVFPYLAGRVDHGLVRKKFNLQHPFRDYIRRFHYDTLTYYPETLRFLIGLVGSDRVVIGTDNFAIMDVEYPNALVEELNLPAADLDRILKGNATRLLRM